MKAEATRIRAARESADPAGAFPVNDTRFEWEPMRLDMVRELGNLAIVRRQVATLPCENHLEIDGLPIHVWVAQNLSDIRLVDILLWKKESTSRRPSDLE